MSKALKTWKTDLFPGVSDQHLDEDLLTYAYGSLPLTINFIVLDKQYAAVQDELKEAPTPDQEEVYLCVDIWEDEEKKKPHYTVYNTLNEYTAGLTEGAGINNVEKRALIRLCGADVKTFMNEWKLGENPAELLDEDLKTIKTMQDIFTANPPGILNVALAAGAGDAAWMELSGALAKHMTNFRSVEIVSAFVFPGIIAPFTAYLTYVWELKQFEKAAGRIANPAERRALRKRSIDIGWQTLLGMMGWTAGYYLTLYVLPIIASAVGWSVSAGGMHLACAIVAGLGQAFFTMAMDYQQQVRELKPGMTVDKTRLASVFVTEFVAGFAWYGMLVIIPAALAQPLSHLGTYAIKGICIAIMGAAVAITTIFANAMVPYVAQAAKTSKLSDVSNKISSTFASAKEAIRSAFPTPPSFGTDAPSPSPC